MFFRSTYFYYKLQLLYLNNNNNKLGLTDFPSKFQKFTYLKKNKYRNHLQIVVETDK